MRLRVLQAEFLRLDEEDSSGARSFTRLGDAKGDADGVMFLCPKCFAENGGEVGTHSILIWFQGSRSTFPVRWEARGSSIDDLTLSPSIALNENMKDVPGEPPICRWHGHVTNGDAT